MAMSFVNSSMVCSNQVVTVPSFISLHIIMREENHKRESHICIPLSTLPFLLITSYATVSTFICITGMGLKLGDGY